MTDDDGPLVVGFRSRGSWQVWLWPLSMRLPYHSGQSNDNLRLVQSASPLLSLAIRLQGALCCL
jgi:hypothetical protein